MAGFRFPNEPEEYRARRDELVEMEKELRALGKRSPEKRRHVDSVWLYWNLLDLTPDGRGDLPVPIQDFEHAYFTRHVLGEAG